MTRRKAESGLFKNVRNDSDQVFSVEPYELCLRNRHTQRNYRPSDTDIHVFSSANDMFIWNTSGNEDDKRRRKMRQLEFAGVASNRARYDPNNNHNEEGLAVQIGGLQTMYNTGTEDINAGDLIMWGLPNADKSRPRIPGVDKSKLLFTTIPYKKHNIGTENLSEHTERALNELATASRLPKTAQNQDQKDEAVQAAFQSVAQDVYELQRRIIGKAMSMAKKGKTFDILLGHYAV